MHATTDSTLYRGRFAPSPTGPLHFGSLVAALGSFLDARHPRGEWLLRMEDIDPPREVEGAADDILFTLESFGLTWDGPVVYQSERSEFYASVLERLARDGHTFGCACSRKSIAEHSAGSTIYPGTCRNGLPPGCKARAIRLRVADIAVGITDRLQGPVEQQLADEVGDFVVRRADMLASYQLAVVVDDAEQGVTDIVRGADLLDSTPRQRYLQSLLALTKPRYLHLPVAVNTAQEKLGKQTRAPAVRADRDNRTLSAALAFLGQPLPEDPRGITQAELLAWAIEHWDTARLPRARRLTAPESGRS